MKRIMDHLDKIRDTANREITEFITNKLREYPVKERIEAVNAHCYTWSVLSLRQDGRIESSVGFQFSAEVFPEYTYEYEEDEWGHETHYLTPTGDVGKTRCWCGSADDVTGPHKYVFYNHIDDVDCYELLCKSCRAKYLKPEPEPQTQP